MRFEKWQALGNDYIVLERDALPFELTAARIRKLCEAHFGVFSDGVLLLSKPGGEDEAAGSKPDRDDMAASSAPDEDDVVTSSTRPQDDVVARLEIYNPDGSRAELSGNGAREAILYLREHGWTDADRFSIQTDAGVVTPQITGPESCRVDMGNASLTSKDYPAGPDDGAGEVSVAGHAFRFRHVSIGNPQCAIEVPDLVALESLDLEEIGPSIEADPRFPNRTNVSWYTEINPASGEQPARVRARIFERGVGQTLSSGTGACGAAIAYALGNSAVGGWAPVQVMLDGGQLLVEVGQDLQIYLTGWARPVFSGCLSDRFIKELHETE